MFMFIETCFTAISLTEKRIKAVLGSIANHFFIYADDIVGNDIQIMRNQYNSKTRSFFNFSINYK